MLTDFGGRLGWGSNHGLPPGQSQVRLTGGLCSAGCHLNRVAAVGVFRQAAGIVQQLASFFLLGLGLLLGPVQQAIVKCAQQKVLMCIHTSCHVLENVAAAVADMHPHRPLWWLPNRLGRMLPQPTFWRAHPAMRSFRPRFSQHHLHMPQPQYRAATRQNSYGAVHQQTPPSAISNWPQAACAGMSRIVQLRRVLHPQRHRLHSRCLHRLPTVWLQQVFHAHMPIVHQPVSTVRFTRTLHLVGQRTFRVGCHLDPHKE